MGGIRRHHTSNADLTGGLRAAVFATILQQQATERSVTL